LLAAERDPSLIASLQEHERSLEQVMPVLHATGAVGESLEIARGYAEEARSELAELPEGEWREALDAIVGGILDQVPEIADAT